MDFLSRYRAFRADGMGDKEARRACQFLEALQAQTANPVQAFTIDAIATEQPPEAPQATKAQSASKATGPNYKGLSKALQAVKGLGNIDPESPVTFTGCTAQQWRKKTQELNERERELDPEAYSMVYLFMGHGSNPTNTFRTLDHALRFESTPDFEHVPDVKRKKRRQKRKKRKSNPKITRL